MRTGSYLNALFFFSFKSLKGSLNEFRNGPNLVVCTAVASHVNGGRLSATCSSLPRGACFIFGPSWPGWQRALGTSYSLPLHGCEIRKGPDKDT